MIPSMKLWKTRKVFVHSNWPTSFTADWAVNPVRECSKAKRVQYENEGKQETKGRARAVKNLALFGQSLVGVKRQFHKLASLMRRGSPLPPSNGIHRSVGQYWRATCYSYCLYGAVRGNGRCQLHNAAEFQLASHLRILWHNARNDFAYTVGLILLSKAGKG